MIVVTVKGFVRGVLGETLTGILDYLAAPGARRTWEGPFNDQAFRQKIFEELITGIGFSAIVETGTFHGATTRYLSAASRMPVYSAELHQRFFAYARTRFLFRRAIHLVRSDARSFLHSILGARDFAAGRIFFYLDAHWENDVPLREEIRIIFDGCPGAVVMVDDFKVPGDPGYAYDDYGDGMALTLEYLKPQIDSGGLAVFFPSAHSSMETGAKRGCVVLARAPDIVTLLRGMQTLR
jgi:predicted O-methyltransferase YrrM